MTVDKKTFLLEAQKKLAITYKKMVQVAKKNKLQDDDDICNTISSVSSALAQVSNLIEAYYQLGADGPRGV